MATVSTGGFVYRAGKKGLDVQTTSGQHVGPGTYDSIPSPSRAGTGFGATERKLLENNAMSAYTPGPGSYQAAQALDAAACKHAESLNFSAPFASATARLHTDKTHAGLPGPGTYAPASEWVKHKHRFTAPPTAQRVSYKRVPSAPSIPYRHQCFGYEEGQAGSLVMQPPPDPIHTGVGRDTVGPGAYDVLRASVEQAPKAVAFGASRTTRGLKVTSTTPGPGQYDSAKAGSGAANGIVVNIAGVDVQFGGAQGSSQFASKVPISSQRQVQEWDRTPGPGAYNLTNSLGSAALPKELQFFGSSARRGSQIDPSSSLSAPSYISSPGPAAYNVPSGSVRVHQQALTDAKPFNSTTNRFFSNSNGIPGPGEYRPDLSNNLAKAVADKAAISKGGVFGSVTERWAQSSKQEHKVAKLPGPADYSGSIPVHKPVHKGHAAAFASRADRFRPAAAPQTSPDLHDPNQEPGSLVKGDPSRMGPGMYNLPDQWGRNKGRHSLSAAAPGFGTTAARHDPARKANNPGPGRYNLLKDVSAALRPLTVPSSENVFGSQVPRFKGPGSYTPGPGQYNTSMDLQRKSYNVTYTGIMV